MKNRMEKFGSGKISLFAMCLLLAFVFLGNVARAEGEIYVEHPVGQEMDGDDIFDADNIYPGWQDSETIRVENKGAEDVNMHFRFDLDGSDKLAEKLKLYVIRDSDDSYRIGGSGDRYTLDEADGEMLYVDKLDAGEAKRYRIKIKFDENADNTYQNLTAKFDIDFRIESEEVAGEDEDDILADEGRVVTGNPPAEEVQGVEMDGDEADADGDEGQAGQTLGVTGATDACQSWPRWAWILALIIFALNFGRNAWKNWEVEKYNWTFPLAWTVLAVAFWYFFDKCREFQWFLQGSIIIAIVLHFSYLYFLRKKIGQVAGKTEIE